MPVIAPDQTSGSAATRWAQLCFGVVCMIMIANLQYGWTLFVGPIHRTHGWSTADVQVAFSIFIALETWLTPGAGWIADTLGTRRGPKLTVALGGLLVAAGWAINAAADSLVLLYLGAALSGAGAGGVYATCVGNAVKWFPDRRGLAVGITAAGFGAGAALTVIPIRLSIAAQGYAATFLLFGLVQGGVVALIALLLRAPDAGEVPVPAAPRLVQSAVSLVPRDVLRAPAFWVLYLMFVLVSASGLMATAQLAVIARDLDIADKVVFFGVSTLSAALVIDNVMNGSARPFFGWISDRIGREYTMALAFGLGAASYWLLGALGRQPLSFVVFAGLIFFTWGEIFSLFPSTCTDTFGPRFATVNASLLYTAKGASAWLVPLANVLKRATGSWEVVFVIAALLNVLVVVLAVFVLRPWRARLHAALAGVAEAPRVIQPG
jgi:MFS transporter, OFA family, oxalate/formate antiporter